MNLLKIILLLGLLCNTGNTEKLQLSLPKVPIIGSVLDSVANVSAGVIDTAIETAQNAGSNILAITDKIKNKILNLLEIFRSKMVDEIIELGLPRLEPFEIKHADVYIVHEIAKINGTIDNVKIENLSKFHVDSINIKLPYSVTLNLTYDILKITGDYDIHGTFGDMINMYGDGHFTVYIYDVYAGVNIVLGFHKDRFTVEQMHLTFKFKTMKCNFENLMGGGENGDLFNKVIGDVAPEAVEYLWPEIEPALSERLRQTASEKLSKIDYKDILDLFNPFK